MCLFQVEGHTFPVLFNSSPTVWVALGQRLVYLFTGAMHINKHNCKRARISPKGYFSSVDP